jgi:glycosyltransferase involved in cell wall biosynthesis
MRILIGLTYFQPHKSGLTVYAVREAKALAARGHDVTVLTSQYNKSLPLEEWDQGVRIVRLPVAFRLSKGVIMPQMLFKAWSLVGEADIVNLHLPQVDAALVTLLAKLRRKPVVLTYHCDLKVPPGFINHLAGWAANLTNRISAGLADVIVHNTRDFAEHSPFLNRYIDKVAVIQPPIVVDPVNERDREDFRGRHHIQPENRIIGIAARLATEKGVEYLVEALPKILAVIPKARVFSVGDYQNVFGEGAYRDKLLPMIAELGDHWTFLGVTSEREKAIFYHVSEVLVLPSINSTESFGMVQVEALTCGTPAVATDLPGVRQPVLSTGMGKIVPIQDADALAEAILDVMQYRQPIDPEKISALAAYYSPETVATEYEKLFEAVLRRHGEW